MLVLNALDPRAYPLDEWVKVVYYGQVVTLAAYLGIRNHLKGIANALGQGNAPQGTREQGREAARVDRPKAEAEYSHFHRGYPSYKLPVKANDCFYAVEGHGWKCIWRDNDFSWLDNIIRPTGGGKPFRAPERYKR